MKNEVDFLKMVKSLLKHNEEIINTVKELPLFKSTGIVWKSLDVCENSNAEMVKAINMRIELLRLKVL